MQNILNKPSHEAWNKHFSTFDAFGREVSCTDALGNAITNSYDVMGTLTSQSGATLNC